MMRYGNLRDLSCDRFTIRGKQLAKPGFLAIMMHNKYGDDEREDGQGDDDDEEEKALPDFREGEEYGIFFSANKKVCVLWVCFVAVVKECYLNSLFPWCLFSLTRYR